MSRRLPTLGFLLLAAAAPAAEPLEVREGLALSGARRGRREAIPADPLAARIVAGGWAAPRAGEAVDLWDGRGREWRPVRAEEGGFRLPPGSYLAVDVESGADRVAILEAAGHGAVYVGEEPHVGDPYATGYVRIPVRLRRGSNPMLFLGGRGRPIPIRLVEPKAPALLNAADATTPDLVRGEPLEADAAVVVLNATDAPLDGLSIAARVGDGPEARTAVPALPPASTRKARFAIRAGAPDADGDRPLGIRLVSADGATLDEATIPLRVRGPGDSRKRTFVSEIDGGVQYYAWVPAAPGAAPGGRPGLVLTLHGASVEASGQAAAYRPKAGLHIVAPTNRRPYGFDWEDWGRKDAIEVLGTASAALDVDPLRTYLTGHSMGGHGTWHLGVTFPGRFAAIAPSAGWVDMAGYGGAARPEQPDPVDAMFARAAGPSDTPALVRNLEGLGVYVLHGDADDNVPVAQARAMRERLGGFHPDFAYYERPGAGHWWGDECVDWPPLFAFLREHASKPAAEVRRVDFATMSPAVSARSAWATIEAQRRWSAPSALHLAYDPGRRRFEGTTENVARLTLDAPAGPVAVALDGATLEGLAPDRGRIRLERDGDGWRAAAGPVSATRKHPGRCGPFKEAFGRRFVLVYGTAGTPAEAAWSLARARLDAETFWYRGNGSPDVVPDAAFLAPERAEEFRGRSVIVYGHASSNAAWAPLLGGGPVVVDRGSVRVGPRELAGDDLACLFVRPRPGDDAAMVGVVAGTGPAGSRLTATLPYFVSGVGFPDLAVVRAGAPATALGTPLLGVARAAIPPHAVGAGFFGDDWGVESGEFAWRE